MIQVNLRDPRPIYEQIKDSFVRVILCGGLKPDDKMPSIRSLAMDLSINPNTIQKAYNDLENEGYIYSVAGKGSFVNKLDDKKEKHIENLINKLTELVFELKGLGVEDDTLVQLVKGGTKND